MPGTSSLMSGLKLQRYRVERVQSRQITLALAAIVGPSLR
jgi:hypothetical protein